MSLDVIKALKTTSNKILIESWNKEGAKAGFCCFAF
jgi:hypothetical protein